MNYIYTIIVLVVALFSASVASDLPQPPFNDNIIEHMIEQHTIHLQVSGCVTGEFNRALGILQSTNLLGGIQSAYANLLPEGEKPEFVVHSITNGHYFYTNKHQERSDVYEISRKVDSQANAFKGVMYVQGERSFGLFESMITMNVFAANDADADLMQYNAEVYVYPHCMALRFFLKYFPGVKLYFRNKTNEMQQIITGIFNYIINK